MKVFFPNESPTHFPYFAACGAHSASKIGYLTEIMGLLLLHKHFLLKCIRMLSLASICSHYRGSIPDSNKRIWTKSQ